MHRTRSFRLLVCALALATAAGIGGCGDDGGIAGTYVLDVDATVASLAKMAGKGAPPEGAMDGMKQMFKQSVFQLELASNHTWTVRVSMKMGNETQNTNEKGTWKQAGDKITFTTTEENGQKPESEKTQHATYSGGKLTISQEGAPFPVVLRKK